MKESCKRKKDGLSAAAQNDIANVQKNNSGVEMARARVLIRNNAICCFKPYHSTWTLRPQLFIAAIDTLAKSL